MKLLRPVLMGLTVTGSMIVLLSSVSFAKPGDETAQIILLYDSAAALQESNPELSTILTKFANEEEKKLEDKNAGKREQVGLKEEERKKHHEDHIKLLRDSATVLQQFYPEIAKRLAQMADDITKVIEKK